MEEQIPLVEGCTAEKFLGQVEPLRRPAVLRGLDLGPCVHKWRDPSYVATAAGPDLPVRIHAAKDGRMDFRAKNFSYRTVTMEELLRVASSGGNNNGELYYLRALGPDGGGGARAGGGGQPSLLSRDFPSLSRDFRLPDGLVDPARLFSSVLRVSSGGVTVWTHYDVTDNVYAQVVGSKEAVLWAPSEALNLYLDGDKSRVVGVDDYDREKFPLFARAKRMRAVLQPGDVLFIPAFWFHNMRALDFGVAVNVFWKNLPQELYDKKDPYGNKDLVPGAKAITMLDNVMRQLQSLPEDVKDFYGRRLIARIQTKCLKEPN